MKYSLIITQIADGENAVTAVDAEGIMDGGVLTLSYSYDGAEYTLEIGPGEMAQTREGDVRLYTHFLEGQTTMARLYDGESGGEFPVCTLKLVVQFDGEDCKADCEFSCGEGGETVNLSVAASVLQ